MYSAHLPIENSLTLNPEGCRWEAYSSADYLLRRRAPESVARLVSFYLAGREFSLWFKDGNCVQGNEREGSIIVFQSWSKGEIFSHLSHQARTYFPPHFPLQKPCTSWNTHSSNAVRPALLCIGFMNGSITHCQLPWGLPVSDANTLPEALHSHTWHLVFCTQTHTAAGLLSAQTVGMFAGGTERQQFLAGQTGGRAAQTGNHEIKIFSDSKLLTRDGNFLYYITYYFLY